MAQLNFQQSLLYSLQCHMILQRENADLVLKKPFLLSSILKTVMILW